MTSRRRQAPDEPLRVPPTRVRHEHGKTSIAQTAARLIAEGLAEHHDAARKAEETSEAKMGKLTGGMPGMPGLPGGLKLPF